MAYPRAGIDVVVPERGADRFLERVHFLVRATGGGHAADGADAMLVLNVAETLGGKGNCLVPTHLPPRIRNPLTDHGLEHPVLVGGIAPGKAALHAGVA